MSAPRTVVVAGETYVSTKSLETLAENKKKSGNVEGNIPAYLAALVRNIRKTGDAHVFKKKKLDDELMDLIETVIVCVRENITPCQIVVGRCTVHGEGGSCTQGEIVKAVADLNRKILKS